MIKKIISLLGVCMPLSSALAQDTLFVSPIGAGELFTREAPGNIEDISYKLSSVAGARHNVVVYFKGGLYELKEPLLITGKEKNRNIDTLTLVGSTSEVAILSGGRHVSGWKQTGRKIAQAVLSENLDFRQLYINEKMAIRARTPNRTNENNYSPYNRVVAFDEKKQTVLITENGIEWWKKTDDIEMIINHHWYQSRFRIDSMSIKDNMTEIKPAMPACKHLFQLTYAKMLASGKPYYFENSPEFLDQEREWYLDKKNSTLYYIPEEGTKIKDLSVTYPVLERIIKIEGNEGKPIENIHIRNLKLGFTNWTIPTRDGIIGTQGVQGRGYTGDMERGILEVEFARNIQISHCHFIGAGDNGILFIRGVKESKIQSSHFDQISANGIVIDTYRKGLQPESYLCEKNLIEDNLIENIGMHYTNGMGLIVSFVAKTTIQYNEIRNGRYTGMQIGNHFGDRISVMRDNVIRRNNIHHVMQLHDDGGAIYTLSLQPGTRIKENWMHDFGRSEWADNFPVNGIFLDNNSGYIRVQDNVFSDLDTVDRIKEQCAGNATTRDNILDNNNSQNTEIKENAGYRGTVGVLINRD